MATTSAPDLPSLETKQTNFEQGVAFALHLWPDLTLAVTNELGGPDSSDKRDWLAGAVADLFPPFPAPKPTTATAAGAASSSSGANADAARQAPKANESDIDNLYIQEFLQGVMEDEFELIVEDGDPSLWKVAEQIVRVRRGCLEGTFDNVEVLGKRWAESKGKSVETLYKRAEDQDQDTDWDSEDGDSEKGGGGADVDMDEAPALEQTKEKAPPEVDEEGFTKVSRKRK